MTRKLTTFFAATAVLTGVTAATAAFAGGRTPAPQPPRTGGAVGNRDGMQVNTMGMIPDQMKQMTWIHRAR
jgi:Spy/CpxP family protein refolding chaperone